MSNKIVLDYAVKLGLQDSAGVKKAEEYLRTLQNNCNIKTITDVAKTILCLDLAASNLGLGFDKAAALKLSALRKSHYQNSYNIIEKMLELDKPKTISEICVQLQCTGAKEFAENILSNYKNHDNKIKDINHPQYIAAAINTACSLENIKINKGDLQLMSRLKRPQWKELTSEFDRFAQTLGLATAKKSGRSKNDMKEIGELNETKQTVSKKMEMDEVVHVEDYEVWRERILREARAELEQC